MIAIQKIVIIEFYLPAFSVVLHSKSVWLTVAALLK